MIAAALSGNTDDLVKIGKYSDLKDINFVRGAISLKERFGSSPPVILIGLWNTAVHPKFERKPNPTRPNPKKKLEMLPIDENLWWEHVNPGKTKPTTIDKERAKELLKLMINTFLRQEKNFPQKINKVIPSQLINQVDLKVEEVRGVLNGIIEEKITEHVNNNDKNKKFDPKKMSSKSEETTEEVANLYELAAGVIIQIEEIEKKNKKAWVLKIGYPEAAKEEKTRALKESKIGLWECLKCLQVNEGDEYCDRCGFTWEEQSEELGLQAKIEIPVE